MKLETPAAEVRKLGELRKLEKVFLPHWVPGAKLAHAAREQLAEYKLTGTVH